MIAEVLRSVRCGLAVLFSGLFYVAASRLNSPRLSAVLYAVEDLTVKARSLFQHAS